MSPSRLALLLPCLSPSACGGPVSTQVDSSGPATPELTTGDSVGPGGGSSAGSGGTDAAPAATTASDGSTGEGVKYDVAGATPPGETCEGAPAGVICANNTAIECDGDGNVVAQESCLPGLCVDMTGCVPCLAGQFRCSGPRVMSCDTSGDTPHWVDWDLCDPTLEEGCNQEFGTCEVLEPIGTNDPTGTYYLYANFEIGGDPTVYHDAGSYGDLVYVTEYLSSNVHVYKITLLDSDNDGELEPNQHPDNPDATGPVEERTLEKIETIPNIKIDDAAGFIQSEIYPIADRMYVGGAEITEYVFGAGAGTVITTAPSWTRGNGEFADPSEGLGGFSTIGYDSVGKVWYAANEAARRVFQYDAETDAWGIAFHYPNLAGWHMDGLEVVTDPNTGTPYVYVSDMTSDFIGQYRLDPDLGWVQENLFQYSESEGQDVEGMGFGALNHFWVTSGFVIYELGGGDLAEYTEPKPEG